MLDTSHKPLKPKTDPRVDAYIQRAAPFAQPVLIRLRKAVHAGCPEVQEEVKWGMPHFSYKGMFCGMAAFKQHCTFGFWKHKLLVDAGLLVDDDRAMGQYGKITGVSDLPSERTLVTIVKAAKKLNDDGVKVPRPARTKRPPVKTPAYLVLALKTNAKARRAYEEFSDSHKREYVEWLGEAKTDETRQKRLDTALTWIAEGKGRNWKYERK